MTSPDNPKLDLFTPIKVGPHIRIAYTCRSGLARKRAVHY